MNQRFFELAKQADLIQWDTLPSGARTPDYTSTVKARRFAEAIVRECAGVELYWLNEQDRKAVAEKIKQHFGVEE